MIIVLEEYMEKNKLKFTQYGKKCIGIIAKLRFSSLKTLSDERAFAFISSIRLEEKEIYSILKMAERYAKIHSFS
jgi:hypothetical protein